MYIFHHCRPEFWAVYALTLLNILSGSDGEAGRVKKWNRNMNFDNAENWQGLVENCGANIYSFNAWMESSVIFLPSHISAKQIILPRNGYFVFQPGLTTLSTSTTCQPKEAKFLRKGALDWYDPDNWRDNKGPENKAIGHVERVPCQFDSVRFKQNSSYAILISNDVTIRDFIFGNESLTYADMALFLSEELAMIQFQKKADTIFVIEPPDCVQDGNCICSNYQDSLKRHICARTKCTDGVNEDTCTNPITPHGFCCPICGYHLRINHKTGFSLEDLRAKVKKELKNSKGSVDGYATRYKETGSHVVLVPWLNKTAEAYKVMKRLMAYLAEDPQVVDISLSKSWESLDDSGAESSKESSGAVVSLVLLIILVLLAGVALFIFYWRRSSIQLSSLWSSCPSFRMPAWLNAATRPSFAFARFSNERISHLNLGPSFEGSIARTEAVDTEIRSSPADPPVGQTMEVRTVGFSNDIYDVVADDTGAVATGAGPMKPSTPQEETEHVYDLIEVSESTSAVLGGDTMELINTSEE